MHGLNVDIIFSSKSKSDSYRATQLNYRYPMIVIDHGMSRNDFFPDLKRIVLGRTRLLRELSQRLQAQIATAYRHRTLLILFQAASDSINLLPVIHSFHKIQATPINGSIRPTNIHILINRSIPSSAHSVIIASSNHQFLITIKYAHHPILQI
ncbi:hypothetical protein O181_044328 [Austropuccinia psidii MF-1]|uniref:Uncharacterized protein n=1 Tax=Austropuccinia psidii MF-1 TaxID=1389203 RepID=A0A9Q3DPV9_9BASI|nr:hypothetical protein [Austropuccinia psidii MF-1]